MTEVVFEGRCPNKNSPEWIKLVQGVGEIRAMKIFMRNGDSLPDMEQINLALMMHSIQNADNQEVLLDEIEKNVDRTEMMKIVNEFTYVMTKHLKKLIHSKDYTRLSEIFTTKSGVNRVGAVQDILKNANLLEKEIENDAKKARSLVISIMQIRNWIKLMDDDVKSILDSNIPILENFTTFQTYLNTIEDWEILLYTAQDTFGNKSSELNKITGEILSNIDSVKKQIFSYDKQGMAGILKEFLIPSGEKIQAILQDEIDTAKKVKTRNSSNPKIVKEQDEKIAKLESQLKEYDFTNNKIIEDFIKGKVNAGFLNTIIESQVNSTNPAIAGFKAFLNKLKNDVDYEMLELENEFNKKIAKLVTDSERFTPETLGKELAFLDTIMGEDGKPKKIYTLINPFMDYRYERDKRYSAVSKLRDAYYEDNNEENKEKYVAALREFNEWEREKFYTEFTQEYYDRLKIWDDEIGQIVKPEYDKLWGRINEIDREINSDPEGLNVDNLLAEKKEKLHELKLMGKLTDLEGNKKQGEALKTAEKLQEVRAKNREIFEYTSNNALFDKRLAEYEQFLITQKGLSESDKEYETLMWEWIKENATTRISQAAYDEQKRLLNTIERYTNKSKNAKLRALKLADLYKQQSEILYGMKDENNITDGTLFSQKEIEKLKELELEIEKAKESFNVFTGITAEDQKTIDKLFDKARFMGLSDEEQEKLDNLLEKTDPDSQYFSGLSESDAKRLKKAYADLANLTEKIPTKYYCDTFNDLSTKYGITINEAGEVKSNYGSGIGFIPVLGSSELKELLKHNDFSEWFHKNHIQVRQYDPKTMEYKKVWRRLKMWSISQFRDPSFYETTELSKSYSFLNGNVLNAVPNSTYTQRKVKKQYITEKIIGQTIDSKGRFLPKPGNFVNPRYEQIRKNKRLSRLLDIFSEYLLKAQENLPHSHKLYLDIPSLEKETTDELYHLTKNIKLSQLPGHIKDRIIERIKRTVSFDDSKEVNYEQSEKDEIIKKYGKEFLQVPMKYTFAEDPENISLNLPRAILKYSYFAARNKTLVKNIPVAKAMERAINKNNDKSFLRRAWETITQSQSRANTSLSHMIDNTFKGKGSNLELEYLSPKSRKLVILIFSILRKMAIWSSIKLNIPSMLANLVQGETQNIVNAANGRFTQRHWAAAKPYSIKLLGEFLTEYALNDLEKKPVLMHLYEKFTPVQGTNVEEMIGEKFSSSKIKDFVGLNWIFNPREWTEQYLQTSTWLATMIATKLNTKSGKTINLMDAYEVNSDNQIVLKEDVIDKSWEIGGKNFEQLKQDVKRINEKSHGNYGEKTILEMYFIGSLFTFLQRFFASTASNRFAFGDTIHDPSYNISEGLRHGFYMRTLSLVIKRNRRLLYQWDTLSKQDKNALLRTTLEVGIGMVLPLLAMSAMGYSGDDKNKKQNLARMSWFQLIGAYLADRLFVESTAYINPKTYWSYFLDFQIKRSLDKWTRFFEDLKSQEYYSSANKDASGDYIYRDSSGRPYKKWKISGAKAIGIYSIHSLKDSPDEMLKTFDQQVRARQ